MANQNQNLPTQGIHEAQSTGVMDTARMLSGTVVEGVQQAIVRPFVETGRDAHRLSEVDAHMTSGATYSEQLAGQELPTESRALRAYRSLGRTAGKLGTPKH